MRVLSSKKGHWHLIKLIRHRTKVIFKNNIVVIQILFPLRWLSGLKPQQQNRSTGYLQAKHLKFSFNLSWSLDVKSNYLDTVIHNSPLDACPFDLCVQVNHRKGGKRRPKSYFESAWDITRSLWVQPIMLPIHCLETEHETTSRREPSETLALRYSILKGV